MTYLGRIHFPPGRIGQIHHTYSLQLWEHFIPLPCVVMAYVRDLKDLKDLMYILAFFSLLVLICVFMVLSELLLMLGFMSLGCGFIGRFEGFFIRIVCFHLRACNLLDCLWLFLCLRCRNLIY